jgi:hypothetical protein
MKAAKLPRITSRKGLTLLTGMIVVILFVAFIIVPILSQQIGISDNALSLTGAIVCFTAALGSFGVRKYMAGKDKKNG